MPINASSSIIHNNPLRVVEINIDGGPNLLRDIKKNKKPQHAESICSTEVNWISSGEIVELHSLASIFTVLEQNNGTMEVGVDTKVNLGCHLEAVHACNKKC